MEIEDELALIRRNGQPQPAPAAVAVPPSAPPASIVKPGYDDLELPEIGLPAPPAEEAGFWDVYGAAWTDETIRTDAWQYRQRQRQALAQEMFDLLPDEDKQAVAAAPWSEKGGWMGLEAELVKRAGQLAAQSPEAATSWAGFPLTPEAFERQIDLQRRRDLDEAQAVLGLDGGGFAEFLGGSARALTDQVSVALLPLGLGGSAFRVIASEAALGAVAEGAVLPREFEVAEELDLADPNALARIALGATLGAMLPAAVIGTAKGVDWYRARRAGLTAARPADADPVEFENGVEQAERAMRGEETPEMAISPDARREGTLGAIVATPNETPFTLPGAEALPYNEGATIRAIIGVESGGNPNAKNPNSSATGAGQFISSTWLDMIKRYRPDRAQGLTDNQILGLRKEGDLSVEMTAYYARENTAKMQAAGITVGPAEVYLAHFMGPGGAIRALTVSPDTPISAIMSSREIAANRGIRFGGKSFADFTAGDLRRWSMRKMRDAYDPNAAVDLPQFAPTSRGYTGSGQVAIGDEFRIDVDYEVVDLSSLTRASGDLQPRDRSRIASDAWIADTAARLDPAQLMPSPTADRGTPIVGPDNVIESGNGRYGAIARAYQRHPDRAEAYRQQIEAAGFAIPADVAQPVLIARRRTPFTPEQRVRATIAAQDSGVAVMTPTEMARASSRAMTGSILSQLDPSRALTDAANGGFVRSVLQGLPRSARNAMFDAGGMLNASGAKQLREALFARAWPDPDILARYTEGDAGDLKSLLEALDSAAPAWAALKADIEAGLVRPEMDISGHVLDAMRLIAAARDVASKQGMPIAKAIDELLEEVDLIEGAIAPLTAALVRKFWQNGRAAKAEDVGAFLTRYAEDARKAGAAGGLFDAPGPRDVLQAIDPKSFADLPEDLGNVRGFAQPADAARAEQIAGTPIDGFDRGAAAPEAEAVRDEIRAELETPRTSAAPKVPKGAQRVAAEVDAGGEFNTLRNDITPVERRWLKSEWQAGRLERKGDNMLRNSMAYRRPRPDIDARWEVSDAFDPATAPMYRNDAPDLAPPAPDAMRAAPDTDPEAARIAGEIDALRSAGFDDFEVELPDGTTTTLRAALDDLDADQGFDAFIQACGLQPNGGAQ